MSDLLDIRRSGPTGEGIGLVVRVLGPTRVERDGDIAAIGGPRQRAVLARLVHADRSLVTAERLIEDVWGEDAPRTAVGTLHSHLSLLRRALGDADLLRRDGPGYVLDVPAGSVDAAAFELLTGRARDALATDPTLARDTAEWALTLWRGPAYADVADTEWGRAAAVHLDELRLVAMQIRFDALIELGPPRRRHRRARPGGRRPPDARAVHRAADAEPLPLGSPGRGAADLRPHPGAPRRGARARARSRAAAAAVGDPRPRRLARRARSAAADRRPHRSRRTAAAEPDAPAGPPPASPVRLPAAATAPPRPRRSSAGPPSWPRSAASWAEARAGQRRMVIVTGEAGAGKTRLVSRFVAGGPPRGRHRDVGAGHHRGDRPVRADRRGPPGRAADRVPRGAAPRRRGPRRAGAARARPRRDRPRRADRPARGRHRALRAVRDGRRPARGRVGGLAARLRARRPPPRPTSCRSACSTTCSATSDRPACCSSPPRGPGRRPRAPHLEEFCANLAPRRVPRPAHRRRASNPATSPSCSRPAAGERRARGPGHPPGHGRQPVLRDRARATTAPRPTTALPDSIRTVLDARLDRLDDQTTRLVALAAVAGPDAAIPVLARAGGFSGDEVLDCVDAAIGEGVLTEDGPTGSVTFPHAPRAAGGARAAQPVPPRRAPPRHRRRPRGVGRRHPRRARPPPAQRRAARAAGDRGPGRARRRARRARRARLRGRRPLGAPRHRGRRLGGPRRAAVRGAAAPLRLPAGPRQPRRRPRRRRPRRPTSPGRRPTRSSSPGPPRASRSPAPGSGFDFGTEDPGLDALLEEALRALPADATSHRARLLGASMSNAAADGDTARMDRLGNLIEHLPDAETHPVLVATVHLARRMAEWRLAHPRRAGGRRPGRRRRGSPGRQRVARAQRAALRRHRPHRGRAHQRGGRVVRAVPDACGGRAPARLRRLRPLHRRHPHPAPGRLREVDPPGRRRPRARPQEPRRATPSRPGPGTCSCRPGTRAASRRSSPSSRAWRAQAGLPIWDIARAASGLAAGQTEAAHATLAALVDDEVHVSDNSLWLTSVGLLVEVARAVGDVPSAARCCSASSRRTSAASASAGSAA